MSGGTIMLFALGIVLAIFYPMVLDLMRAERRLKQAASTPLVVFVVYVVASEDTDPTWSEETEGTIRRKDEPKTLCGHCGNILPHAERPSDRPW